MHLTEQYSQGSAIDALYAELKQLQLRYGELLEHEALSDHIATLTDMIEDFMGGSLEANVFLQDDAPRMLKKITDTLRALTAEQTRMLDESPTAARRASGRHIHQYSQAEAIALDATATLFSFGREFRH